MTRILSLLLTLACLPLLGLTLPRLWGEWSTNPNSGHVALSLPIGLILLIRNWVLIRRDGKAGSLHPAWGWGLFFMMGSLLCLWADARLEENSILFVGLFFAIAAAGALLLGVKRWRGLWLPLLLIAFALPLPETIATNLIHIHLQRAAAASAGGLLALGGLPAEVNGTVILVSGQALNIIEQCSGLKFMTVLVFASLLLGMQFGPRQFLARFFLVLLSPVVAFITNIVRLVIAGVIAHRSGPDALASFLHEGWAVMLLYAGGIGLLFLLGDLLREAIRPTVKLLRETKTQEARK